MQEWKPDAKQQVPDAKQAVFCEVCGTIIEPDPGFSQIIPADDSGRLKSWMPNMTTAFHREYAVVGSQLGQQAEELEQEVRGLAGRLHMFAENPHVQDAFGDRLCNLRDNMDYLIGRMQHLAALLARLDVDNNYQQATPLPVPLEPPGWRFWTRTYLPL